MKSMVLRVWEFFSAKAAAAKTNCREEETWLGI